MPVGLLCVLRLQQQAHLDARDAGVFKALPSLHERRTGGPGEVVDVILHVAMDDVGCRRGARLLGAGGADGPIRWHGDPHVVTTEVAVAAGVGERLMRHPAPWLEHAEFGEPLRGNEVVVDRTGAIEVARKPPAPADAQVQRLVWLHGLGHLRGGQRSVAGIAVAGRDVAERRHQVLDHRAIRRHNFQSGDLHESEVALGTLLEGRIARQRALLQPGGVSGAERVPVQVQPDRIGRHYTGVAPRDGLAAGQQARCRLEGHVDVVVDVPG